MTTSTREKRIKFIESFGSKTFMDQVAKAIRADGMGFLTDDQIERVCEITAQDARFANRMNVRNRAIYQRRAAAM